MARTIQSARVSLPKCRVCGIAPTIFKSVRSTLSVYAAYAASVDHSFLNVQDKDLQSNIIVDLLCPPSADYESTPLGELAGRSPSNPRQRSPPVIHKKCWDIINGFLNLSRSPKWTPTVAEVKFDAECLFRLAEPEQGGKDWAPDYLEANTFTRTAKKHDIMWRSRQMGFVDLPEWKESIEGVIQTSTETGLHCDEEARSILWDKCLFWVLEAPDKFPIAEAYGSRDSLVPRQFTLSGELTQDGFTSTPTEILLLIVSHLPLRSLLSLAGTSKFIRARLVPNLDSISRGYTAGEEWEWCLPFGEEKRPWSEIIDSLGEARGSFPWYAYLRCCNDWRCRSMKNRKRIFKVIRQLEVEGTRRGFIG